MRLSADQVFELTVHHYSGKDMTAQYPGDRIKEELIAMLRVTRDLHILTAQQFFSARRAIASWGGHGRLQINLGAKSPHVKGFSVQRAR